MIDREPNWYSFIAVALVVNVIAGIAAAIAFILLATWIAG